MEERYKILLIEDNPDDVELLKYALKNGSISFQLHAVNTAKEFIKELQAFQPNVILSDHSLPGFNSLEALEIVRERDTEIPFILVTGTVSEEFAVTCMKAGVDDYILKGNLTRLPSSIQTIFTKKTLKREKDIIELLHVKLQKAYEEIERKNKSITDSIHYAKRIQKAMLPDKEVMTKFFPQSFIINKPKDIISGDFYWFIEHNNKFMIVVVDCTGHGVPGALMSMIGHNLLNVIVKEQEIWDLGDVLKRMHKGIRNILKQDKHSGTTNDGMDIAICTIDRTNFNMEFAGANRPLFYVHEGEFALIKGNRFGIGGMEATREFTSHKMTLKEGSRIFMFTDGYADQFGGRRERKMMTYNFIKLLRSVPGKDMIEQKEILNQWLGEWKGDLEQTDDILIVGIEI